MNTIWKRVASIFLLLSFAAGCPTAAVAKRHKGETRLENVEGGAVVLSQFQGKATVLIVCGKNSADAGNALMREITLDSAKQTEINYVLTADLRGAPGFFRGQIRGKVKGEMKRQRDLTVESFKRAGVAYEPRHASTILLDWIGNVAKTYALKGNLDSAYRVIVLDRKGNVTYQCVQPDKKGEAAPAAPILKALKDAQTHPKGA